MTTKKTWERNTDGLTSYKPAWKHGTTRTIRVPVALADQILEYAHALDNGNNLTTTNNNAIAPILAKIDKKLPGYKSNSAAQLIKDLRALTNVS